MLRRWSTTTRTTPQPSQVAHTHHHFVSFLPSRLALFIQLQTDTYPLRLSSYRLRGPRGEVPLGALISITLDSWHIRLLLTPATSNLLPSLTRASAAQLHTHSYGRKLLSLADCPGPLCVLADAFEILDSFLDSRALHGNHYPRQLDR